jgi:hypothetical protein
LSRKTVRILDALMHPRGRDDSGAVPTSTPKKGTQGSLAAL